MANVKLKANIIVGGTFLKFGTIIDESKVPPRLRKRKYILREGEIDYDAINLKAQMAVAEQEVTVDELLEEEEERPKVNIANRRLPRR